MLTVISPAKNHQNSLKRDLLRRNKLHWPRLIWPGIKGRNAPERSSWAREFGQKRSGAQKSNYLGRNARSTAHKNLISAFRHACFRKSRYVTLISGTLSKFLRSRDQQQQHEETCRVFRTAYYIIAKSNRPYIDHHD